VTSGASSSQACEAVGVDRRQGYRWRRDSGGQPPPAARVVSARYLCLEERLQIADLHLAGASRRAIAAQLGRAPSTISRELRRNGPVAGRARYAPYAAHKRAGLRARRPKPFKLEDARLALAVQDKLCRKWRTSAVDPAASSRPVQPKATRTKSKAWMPAAIETVLAITVHAMDATESRDVHEILTERDRAGSVIITSNRGPDEWLATFADPVRAQAAIDRFTSNAYDLVIEGESYRKRLKPKSPAAKAGQKKG